MKNFFLWCLLAHRIDIAQHPERVTNNIAYEHTLNMQDVTYPVPLPQISRVETQNNLRINVYGYENDQITILRVSDKELPAVNLMLLAVEEKQHYCLIKNFSRLMNHRTAHNGAEYYCYRCLHGFRNQDLLEKHTPYWKTHAAQAIQMPDEHNNILKFTGNHFQHPINYIICADFESLLLPIDTSAPSAQSSYIQQTAHRVASGYAYVVINSQGKAEKPITIYRGENAVDHFLDNMIKETLRENLSTITPMNLSKQ